MEDFRKSRATPHTLHKINALVRGAVKFTRYLHDPPFWLKLPVFLVKIANSNIMPTLRGFRWYPYFGAQE